MEVMYEPPSHDVDLSFLGKEPLPGEEDGGDEPEPQEGNGGDEQEQQQEGTETRLQKSPPQFGNVIKNGIPQDEDCDGYQYGDLISDQNGNEGDVDQDENVDDGRNVHLDPEDEQRPCSSSSQSSEESLGLPSRAPFRMHHFDNDPASGLDYDQLDSGDMETKESEVLEDVEDVEEQLKHATPTVPSGSLSLQDPLYVITLRDERGGRRRRKHVNEDNDGGVKSSEEEDSGDAGSEEIQCDSTIDNPRGCKDGHIMLVGESFEPVPSGMIALGPLPFLSRFTAFGSRRQLAKNSVEVQSRWNLVRIPLRGPLGPRCPINKYSQELPKPSSPSSTARSAKEYIRPPVPLDPTKKRPILHHFPVTGDKEHMFELLTPSGNFKRRSGGGWHCRKWTKRKHPPGLINHTEEEWKAFLKAKERMDAIEDAKFRSAFKDVLDGIAGVDQGIMKETHTLVSKENIRRAEKMQDMYDQWDLSVFNYIQRQTQYKINDPSYDPDAVTAKQMDRQKKYCRAWQKRRLFLDIIHPEEYDPYEYQDTAMKYSTSYLYDPIKHDWTKERKEKIFMGENPPITASGRETLELASWPEPNFKTTMSGRVCCDDELVGDRQHLAKVPEKWASHPVLYNKRWGPEFWHTSFPKGGKNCAMPRPEEQRNDEPPPPRGVRIVWDAPQKLQRKLQISEENPQF